ncbi:MAG TPA: hypothetical protein DCW72_08340 [Elusimicrobia bacterium]|nr:hypothetical protein [Elusimicrobiota bacterium]
MPAATTKSSGLRALRAASAAGFRKDLSKSSGYWPPLGSVFIMAVSGTMETTAPENSSAASAEATTPPIAASEAIGVMSSGFLASTMESSLNSLSVAAIAAAVGACISAVTRPPTESAMPAPSKPALLIKKVLPCFNSKPPKEQASAARSVKSSKVSATSAPARSMIRRVTR